VFSIASISVIRVTRAIYRLAGEGTLGIYVRTEFNNILNSRSSVPSSGELFSNEKLRLRPSSGVMG
jgi:hypothetical protein